jgi:hypothetical protein
LPTTFARAWHHQSRVRPVGLNVLYFESRQLANVRRSRRRARPAAQIPLRTNIACIGEESQYDRSIKDHVARFLGIGDRGYPRSEAWRLAIRSSLSATRFSAALKAPARSVDANRCEALCQVVSSLAKIAHGEKRDLLLSQAPRDVCFQQVRSSLAPSWLWYNIPPGMVGSMMAVTSLRSASRMLKNTLYPAIWA